LPLLKFESNLICAPCRNGEMIAASHSPVNIMMYEQSEQLLHVDTVGPSQVCSVGTLQTWYSFIQASSKDKEHGVHPCNATCCHKLPCVPWLRTLSPYSGGLWHCHLSHSSRPHLLLVFLSHRIICKRTYANYSLHPRVFQGIESTRKQ
jgi:hypothetical protein